MATVPVPATIVAGSSPTAANLNTFRDGVNWAQTNRPLAMFVQQATQNLATSTWTATTFGASSEALDRDGGHSTSSATANYVAQTAGWYRCAGGIHFAGDAAGFRAACITRINAAPGANGHTFGYATAFPSSATQVGVTAGPVLMYLDVGEDIQLKGIQSSGGTLATTLALGGSWMAVEWVGTA